MAHLFLILNLYVGEAVGASTTNATSSGRQEGWVSSPNGRGTFDIIWGCLLTIFLCTWTSLHLNIPSLHEKYLHRWFRKLRWVRTFQGRSFLSRMKIKSQDLFREQKVPCTRETCLVKSIFASNADSEICVDGASYSGSRTHCRLCYRSESRSETLSGNVEEFWIPPLDNAPWILCQHGWLRLAATR